MRKAITGHQRPPGAGYHRDVFTWTAFGALIGFGFLNAVLGPALPYLRAVEGTTYLVGGPPPSNADLDIDVGTYDCTSAPSGECWGSITGSGLNPNSSWFVFDGSFVLRTGQTDSNGSISATPLGLSCLGDNGALFAAQAESSTGVVIAAAGAPC